MAIKAFMHFPSTLYNVYIPYNRRLPLVILIQPILRIYVIQWEVIEDLARYPAIRNLQLQHPWLIHALSQYLFRSPEASPFWMPLSLLDLQPINPDYFYCRNRGQKCLWLPQATNSTRTISTNCPRNYKRNSQKHRADPHDLGHGKHAYYPNITKMPITASRCSSGNHIESFAILNT